MERRTTVVAQQKSQVFNTKDEPCIQYIIVYGLHKIKYLPSFYRERAIIGNALSDFENFLAIFGCRLPVVYTVSLVRNQPILKYVTDSLL